MGSTKSTLRPEVVHDLQETTDFSASEIGDLYRQYIHDCNGNLHMTREQFTRMYDEIFPEGEAAQFAEHVFRTFDKEGKGMISFRQFMTTLSIQLKGSLEQKLTWAFDLYDIHKNGIITRDESKEIIQVLQNMRAGHVPHEDNLSAQQLSDYIFRKADKENENHISRKDFVHAAMASNTMQALLKGTFMAAAEPFMMRKQRSGSFGRPRSNSHKRLDGSRSPSTRSPSGSFSENVQASSGRRGSLPPAETKGPLNTLKVQDTRPRSTSYR